MTNMIKRVILTTLLLTVASTGMKAQAQWGGDIFSVPRDRRNNDRTDQIRDQFGQRLDNLVNDASRFRRSFDSGLDRSRLNDSRREDQANEFVRDFEQQTRRVRDRFRNRQAMRDELQVLFSQTQRIDTFMQRNRLSRDAQSDWSRVRDDVSQLRNVFDRFDRSDRDNRWLR